MSDEMRERMRRVTESYADPEGVLQDEWECGDIGSLGHSCNQRAGHAGDHKFAVYGKGAIGWPQRSEASLPNGRPADCLCEGVDEERIQGGCICYLLDGGRAYLDISALRSELERVTRERDHAMEQWKAANERCILRSTRNEELSSAMRCEIEFMHRNGYVPSSNYTATLEGTRA